MRIASLAKAALAPLVLAGCAAQTVVVEIPPPPPAAPPRAETPSVRPSLITWPGRAGVVVGVPRASRDAGAADIAALVAERTGFGLVVASGFPPEVNDRLIRRSLASRPLDGLPDGSSSVKRPSAATRCVATEYERCVRETARGALVFYVEVSQDRPELGDRFEIATVGVDREHAMQLRTLFELIRDAHLRAHAGVPRLGVLIEPADPLIASAGAATHEHLRRFPERALHIELPRTAARETSDVYTAILGDFLAEAVALRPFR
jgi:hypothetical protein